MKFFKQTTAILLVLVLFGIGFTLHAQTRINNKNVEFIVKRLEANTDQFRGSLDDPEFINARNEDMRESLLEARVAAFELVTDRLLDRFEDNEVIPYDVEDVLSRALVIEQALQKAKISADARADWMRIRTNLDNLAKAYNVTWIWTLDANPYWTNPKAVERIVDRLEARSDEFRISFDYALDTSRLDGTELEDKAIKLAEEFEEQIDRWEDLADNERLSQANVEGLLTRAATLDAFMRANNLMMSRAWRDWAQVKTNLDELAMMAKIDWKWQGTPVVPNQKATR